MAHLLASFEVIPSLADEHTSGLSPRDAARAIAERKAESIFVSHPDAAVLGADTVVAFEGRMLGKPRDAEDAKRTLALLSGKTHEVFTGWCLLAPGRRASGVVRSGVTFHRLSEPFICEYVASGKPMDKAGSYGIQDDARIVERFEGSLTNIIGLPEEEIKEQLQKFGLLK